MYTYSADITTPTIDSCTFYGINQNTGDVIKLEGAPKLMENGVVQGGKLTYSHPLEVQDYIFSNIEEKQLGKHREANLGEFQSGVKVGFCFEGKYDFTEMVDGKSVRKVYPHFSFTTPCLNDNTHSNGLIAKNDRNFKYSQPTTQGCIKKIEVGGRTYYVLGMENCYPDGLSYDADFNDMLCIIEVSNDGDIDVNPSIPNIDLETCKYARGYYLFEDNYPHKGDFDFNDVVVLYEIKTFVNRRSFDDNYNEVNVALLANGCSMSNEFGFYVGEKDDTTKGKFITVFPKIQGYFNVSDTKPIDLSNLNKYSFTCAGNVGGSVTKEGAMIRPYLKNRPNNSKETNVIYDNSFTREGNEYPYVLDVPLESTAYNYTSNFNYTVEKEAGNGFRWCSEGNKITDAYKETPKTLRWYLKGYKNESLLIKREQ